MEKTDTARFESELDSEFVKTWGTAEFVAYRRGARVCWVPISAPEEMVRGIRGKIGDLSHASRMRLAFTLGNATCDWLLMGLFTFRDLPSGERYRRAKRRFIDRWRARWGEPMDAWAMEMQQRGCPHLHTFHAKQSNFGVAALAAFADGRFEAVREKDGAETLILRGNLDVWARNAWLDCVGATDAESRWFAERGMFQFLRKDDAPARYMAIEASKREQKELPAHYADGLGRWWWMNPKWTPVPDHAGVVDLSRYPYAKAMRYVWDANDLTPAVVALHEREVTIDVETGETTQRFVRDGELSAE